jgi:hypothetical protein
VQALACRDLHFLQKNLNSQVSGRKREGKMMGTEKQRLVLSVSIFLLLFLAACSSPSAQQATPTFETILLPSPTPTSLTETAATLIQLPVVPTSTPTCVNGLGFINDVTIPDGTVVTPETSLDKQWLVQNSGTCNWDQRYRMRMISGEALGAAVEQSLYPARSGSQATLRIIFTAPSEPGEYVSEWQAFDFNGLPFGDTFFIKINVQEEVLPTQG